jgi:hypothetical protein
VSNSMYSCTQGVDIGNRIVDHPTAETKMAFMDVEGQGDGKGQVSMCVPADAACCCRSGDGDVETGWRDAKGWGGGSR